MTIPVRGTNGLAGVLVLEADRANAFDSEDLRSLEAVARFLGIAIRTRRAIGVAARVQRTPFVMGVVIASLLLLTFFLVSDFFAKSTIVRDRTLATQDERARVVANDLDATLRVAQQVARSATAVLAAIHRDRPRMETTLFHMLVSTPADTIYGIGIWFEPQKFDPRIDRFALYAHRNFGGADVLTERYATRGYNYLRRDWYRDGERALGNPIYTPPNVDTDVAVISVVQGFYDRVNGRFGGDVTVNLGLPHLRTIIRRFNEVAGRLVYVTDTNGTPFIYPDERGLSAYARKHGGAAGSLPIISAATLQDYIRVTHPGARFDRTVPVRQAGWIVHVSTLNDRLYDELSLLQNELARTLLGLWVAGALCLLLLRVRYVHARGSVVAEVEKTHLLNENVRREQVVRRLERVAYLDPLTGLPNRAQVIARVDQLLKQTDASPFAVLYIDLDRLNAVNDRYGRENGDLLLRSVAERLSALLPAEGFLGRISGDEFLIVLPSLEAPETPESLARTIVTTLMDPFAVGEYEIVAPAQVGIAFGPADYANASDILRDADLAMDAASVPGGERWRVFDRTLNERLASELTLERELRRAIERSEFRLYLQPIVSLATSAIEGFEALLRWQHPRRGMLSPGDFLPVAECAGLIVEIGNWVIAEAARHRAVLGRAVSDRPLYVSVNLGAPHYADHRLPGTIRSAIQRCGIPFDSIKVELTEGTLMEEGGVARQILDELAAMGVRAYLDDFGTGYSSLGYLHRFPLEALKIDRSFVVNIAESIESREIVRTIVLLAKTLSIGVTAEGVERPDHVHALTELGVGHGQGYLYGRPADIEAATRLLLAEPQAGAA